MSELDPEWPDARSWYGLSSKQRDYGHEVSRLAAMYSSPIIMSADGDPPILHNATGFLLELGGRTLLITNSHVAQWYRDLCAEHGDVEFQFGGAAFAPAIISECPDEDVDLAVIDVSEVAIRRREEGYWKSSADYLQPYYPASWPIAPATKGDATVTVGWPAKYRTEIAERHLEFAAFPMLGPFVDEVKKKWFSIPFNRQDWVGSDWDPNNPVVFETALGGMSGAPVFALHRRAIQPVQLIGIVRTYGVGFDVLYCTRADLIVEDGSICLPGE
jgi:hypothetical protein